MCILFFETHRALVGNGSSEIKKATDDGYKRLAKWMEEENRMHTLEMDKAYDGGADDDRHCDWVSPRNFVHWVPTLLYISLHASLSI